MLLLPFFPGRLRKSCLHTVILDYSTFMGLPTNRYDIIKGRRRRQWRCYHKQQQYQQWILKGRIGSILVIIILCTHMMLKMVGEAHKERLLLNIIIMEHAIHNNFICIYPYANESRAVSIFVGATYNNSDCNGCAYKLITYVTFP